MVTVFASPRHTAPRGRTGCHLTHALSVEGSHVPPPPVTLSLTCP